MSDQKFRFGLINRSNEEAVPEDEPVFLLRARDYLAIPTLKHYKMLSIKDGCNDFHMDGLAVVIASFEDWQTTYPSQQNQPGLTLGPRLDAYKIVETLLNDLKERRGLRHEWHQIKPEIQREIVEVWTRRVEVVLRG